ncbi:MAG: hypothetical protein H0V32_13920 [Nocardioidaceae bacterium]|nr:hypothetical protein [Nocardioidaceae bacterium]
MNPAAGRCRVSMLLVLSVLMAGPIFGSTSAAVAAGDADGTSHASAANLRWRQILSALLARRERAYASGQVSGLRLVHQHGSPMLAADRAVLRSWVRRDLTVSWASRLARVRLVTRQPGSARLRTVSSLQRAVATGRDGSRRRLPRDQPTAHRVLLVRTADGWRIGAVRALSG